MNWNLPQWVPLKKFFFKVFFQTNNLFFRNKKNFSKEQLLFNLLCIVQQKKFLERSENFWNFSIFKNHKVNWDPPWRISIHCDYDSLGCPLSPCVSFSSCQRNLIKTFQIDGMIALITKMDFIFSWDLLNGQK